MKVPSRVLCRILAFESLFQAAARLGFAKESRDLWKSLDKDDSGSASIDELDPRSAETLAHFKAGTCSRPLQFPKQRRMVRLVTRCLRSSAGLGQLSVRGSPGSL